jgi:hypothetical protein
LVEVLSFTLQMVSATVSWSPPGSSTIGRRPLASGSSRESRGRVGGGTHRGPTSRLTERCFSVTSSLRKSPAARRPPHRSTHPPSLRTPILQFGRKAKSSATLLRLSLSLTTKHVAMFPNTQFTRLVLRSVGSPSIAREAGFGKRNSSPSSLQSNRKSETNALSSSQEVRVTVCLLCGIMEKERIAAKLAGAFACRRRLGEPASRLPP